MNTGIDTRICLGNRDCPPMSTLNNKIRTGILVRKRYLASSISVMHGKDFKYYSQHEPRILPDQKQLITYTFNEQENTIPGIMLEIGDTIFLYEYRGAYIGNEFFISFSKNSISYKLIKVVDVGKPRE